MKLTERIQHAWNAFTGRETSEDAFEVSFGSMGGRPGHKRAHNYSTTDFASSIFNRIAIDVATTTFEHVRIDKKDGEPDGNSKRVVIDSGINYCLNTEANIDQSSTAFIQDLVYSMFDEGVVAIVPIETSISPYKTGGFEIHSLRVGKIVEWYPLHVRVEVYNELTGKMQELYLKKEVVGIIENPLYPITNEDNSVLKRLTRKMAEIDDMDSKVASGKLDLLIQLPFAMKTEGQRKAAKERIKNIEDQLKSNSHGMAYIDATEKITQLNRPVHDQLLDSVEMLTEDFYNQLGLTANIFNGTAKEEEVRLYYTRAIDPIVAYIVEELSRKFLTKTARTQGHKFEAYRDMFQFVSIGALADMSDKFKRNAIMTTNEIRATIRMAPHSDPRSDELYNPNMPDSDQGIGEGGGSSEGPKAEEDPPELSEEEEKEQKKERAKELKEEKRKEKHEAKR